MTGHALQTTVNVNTNIDRLSTPSTPLSGTARSPPSTGTPSASAYGYAYAPSPHPHTPHARRPTIATTTYSHVAYPTHPTSAIQTITPRLRPGYDSTSPDGVTSDNKNKSDGKATVKAKGTTPHISRPGRWQSVLYQLSFTLCILILAAVLTGSAWGLGEQAWRSGGQRRWNIVIISGAYVAVVSVGLCGLFWGSWKTELGVGR